MTAAEIIRQVRSADGQIAADGADLVVTAPRPLPAELLDRLKAHKPAILAALTKPDPSPPHSAIDLNLAASYDDPALAPFDAAYQRKAVAEPGYEPAAQARYCSECANRAADKRCLAWERIGAPEGWQPADKAPRRCRGFEPTATTALPAIPPLSPAAEARRQKVLAIPTRDGGQYAALVEDPNTDPVIMALATPDGTCEVLIPRDRYDPFAVLATVKEWEREDPDPEPLWWRVAIREPGARTVEVDTPSGYTFADWQAYADRYHGPECAVTAIAGLPKPRAPVNLDEALAAACDGVAGITPAQVRSLLAPEDVADIEAGDIHPKTLHAYALSFAEGRSGRLVPTVTP